jgi:hypothetical protein
MRRSIQMPVLALLGVVAATWSTAGRGQDPKLQEQIQNDLQAIRQSAKNLKLIGLALQNYHDSYNKLPASSIDDKNGKAMLSWRVAILPFLDHDDLYRQFNLDEPWNSEHNKKLLGRMPDAYKSPGAIGNSTKTYYQVLTGPVTVFPKGVGIRMTSITDGLSNTILAVEASEAVPWTKPADVAYDARKKLPKFGGLFKGGFNILLCDGSTLFVRHNFDAKTFCDAITPRGGEVLDLEKLRR